MLTLAKLKKSSPYLVGSKLTLIQKNGGQFTITVIGVITSFEPMDKVYKIHYSIVAVTTQHNPSLLITTFGRNFLSVDSKWLSNGLLIEVDSQNNLTITMG